MGRRQKGVGAAATQRADFYESAWKEAAVTIGATFEPIEDGIAEIRLGNKRTRVYQNSSPLDDEITLAIAGNKPLVYRLLTEQGLPLPKHLVFSLSSLPQAAKFMEEAGGECVVKPAKSTGGGVGVTTGVTRKGTLLRAALVASAHDKELLIEQQIPGENYRVLYLDGVMLDAVNRRPPGVIGDGKSTIKQLVERANQSRLVRGASVAQVLVIPDLEMKNTLAKQGLSLTSVPEAGKFVKLKTVINQNCTEENVSAADKFCPEVIEAGARAARAIGARLAGIDIITSDPGRPLSETGGVILEVNTTPGYHYHYHKLDGRFPVAEYVLKRIFNGGGVSLLQG